MPYSNEQIRDYALALEQKGAAPEEIDAFVKAALRENAPESPTAPVENPLGRTRNDYADQWKAADKAAVGMGVGDKAKLGLGLAANWIKDKAFGSPKAVVDERSIKLQDALGLADPISGGQSISLLDRMNYEAAPTPEERDAMLRVRFGARPEDVKHVNAALSLVRVPDDKGGKHWVPVNPQGLDAGDVMALAVNGPELVSSIVAGTKAVGGPASAAGKILTSSGASAVVGNAIGAIQDAAWRFINNQEIRPDEIAARRGQKAAIEFGAGSVLGGIANSVTKHFGERRAAAKSVEKFVNAGDEAKQYLKDRGVRATSVSEVGDSVRGLVPNASAEQAGETIGRIITDADQALRGESENLIRKSAESLQNVSQRELAAATAAPVAPRDASLAAIGSVKSSILKARNDTNKLLGEALDEISQDAIKSGKTIDFVNLKATKDLIAGEKGNLLKGKDGEALKLYAPLLSMLNEIEQGVDVGQKLQAVRNLRTKVGARSRGEGVEFLKDLDQGAASQLYKALTADIDNSIASFSGSGAKKLKQYNAAYKALLDPLDESPFLNKMVNGGFSSNPEEMITALSKGGSGDWKVAKSYLDPVTYNQVRRATVDKLIGGSEVDVAGQKVADLMRLGDEIGRIKATSGPETLNEMFGTPAAWQLLERRGRELAYLQKQQGLFTQPSLPDMDQLFEAMSIAKRDGFDKANAHLSAAINAVQKRRENMADSLVSLAKSGNTKYIVENPAGFFDDIVFSGKYPARTVKDILTKLPKDKQAEFSNAAFQRIFDRARDNAHSVVNAQLGNKGGATYNVDRILEAGFGGKPEQNEAIKAVLGEDRFKLLEKYTEFMVGMAARRAKTEGSVRNLAGLVAVAPYHNLFAARATAFALDQAAGRAFMQGATPEAAELFAEARAIMKNPKQTAAKMTLIQKAIAHPNYDNYSAMMENLSPEQQDAVDEYLTGRTK